MPRLPGKLIKFCAISILFVLFLGLMMPGIGLSARFTNVLQLHNVYLPLVRRHISYAESQGILDASFGDGGRVISDLSGANESGAALALQGDGKLLVGGQIDGTYNVDVGVARYYPDGNLDLSFSIDGWVSTDLLGEDQAAAIAIQQDGKILLAGTAAYDFALVRYTADGALDSTFGVGGWVRTDLLGSDDQANALAIQPDGCIIVVGKALNSSGNYDFALVRYLANGDLDLSFGTSGKVTTDLTTQQDIIRGIALQPDGKIIAVGPVKRGGSYHDFGVARYNSDGTLDTSFGTAGLVFTDFEQDHDFANAVVLQPDGRIVVAGAATKDDAYWFAIARYTPTGLLDASFGTNGRVMTFFGPGHDDGYAITLQPDGKLILASYADLDAAIDFIVVRYNPNGSLDAGFSEVGWVMTDFAGGDDFGLAVVLQPDGEIVVAGSAFTGLDFDFGMLRYR